MRKYGKPEAHQIPSGICECGCGKATNIAKYTDKARGYWRGHPMRRLKGHGDPKHGPEHHLWRGGTTMRGGYRLVCAPDHPECDKNGYVAEHRLNWELANGRRLLPGEVVHHINGDKLDNRPENLVAITISDHAKEHTAKRIAGQKTWFNDRPGIREAFGLMGADKRWNPLDYSH